MQTACIYHAECIDGAAAAAVVCHKYPDAEMYPMNHGEPLPKELQAKRVFVVDFSFDAKTFQELKKTVGELVWLDHHKTAIAIQEQVGFGIIDLAESGATLTWKQLFPKEELPRILAYVKDKDIWAWQLPDSREINHSLRATEGILDPTHPIWKRFLLGISENEWNELIECGKKARRLQRERFALAVEKGFEIKLNGHKALAVNWTDEASEIGEYIYKELHYPVALLFSYEKNRWAFSLRSNTVDVSDIALTFGGGGHPGAAGFRTESIKWLFEKKS